MTIVEYKLDPQDQPESYHPKTIPTFITAGGDWRNPDNYTMIGIQVEGSTLPDTATILNLEELQARQRAIHAKYPMKKDPVYAHQIPDAENMTDDEVNASIKAWVDER
tara:strand:- start:183 stop:506 length:324 start_codon:yes stop_codon:yes gene_type:complete